MPFWIIERPAHPVLGGQEGDLVAGLEIEPSQANNLERPGDGGMAGHCEHVNCPGAKPPTPMRSVPPALWV